MMGGLFEVTQNMHRTHHGDPPRHRDSDSRAALELRASEHEQRLPGEMQNAKRPMIWIERSRQQNGCQ